MTAAMGIMILSSAISVGLLTVFLSVKPGAFRAWEIYYLLSPLLSWLFMYETSTRPSFSENLSIWFEYMIAFVSVGLGIWLMKRGIISDVKRGKHLLEGLKEETKQRKTDKKADKREHRGGGEDG